MKYSPSSCGNAETFGCLPGRSRRHPAVPRPVRAAGGPRLHRADVHGGAGERYPPGEPTGDRLARAGSRGRPRDHPGRRQPVPSDHRQRALAGSGAALRRQLAAGRTGPAPHARRNPRPGVGAGPLPRLLAGRRCQPDVRRQTSWRTWPSPQGPSCGCPWTWRGDALAASRPCSAGCCSCHQRRPVFLPRFPRPTIE